MANPKRRFSRSRRDSRRASWKLTNPATSNCPRCHQPKPPHHVCANCGYYKGKAVLTPK